jgi:hypothetical protein
MLMIYCPGLQFLVNHSPPIQPEIRISLTSVARKMRWLVKAKSATELLLLPYASGFDNLLFKVDGTQSNAIGAVGPLKSDAQNGGGMN